MVLVSVSAHFQEAEWSAKSACFFLTCVGVEEVSSVGERVEEGECEQHRPHYCVPKLVVKVLELGRLHGKETFI